MNDNSLERQREHFNSIADAYAEGRKEPTHLRIKHLIWEQAAASLPDLKGRHLRVLEAMCGYAEGRDIVAKHFSTDIEYSGFDYSDRVVETLCSEHPGIRVWQADATRFTPEAGQFDLVVLIGGLHHVPNHSADVVRRLSTGLAPGGVFLNFEPTHGNPLFRWIRDVIYRRNAIFDDETERAFPIRDLESMFEAAGLDRHFQYYPGLLAYVLYYNPYAFPWLNRGGTRWVDIAFGIDRLFMRNWVGRIFSFATLGVWRKP